MADGNVPVRRADLARLCTNWTFCASRPAWRTKARRLAYRLTRRRPFPATRLLRTPTPAARWNCLFLFLPQGKPDGDQRQMIARLRRLHGKLLIVFASPACPDRVPSEIEAADAVVWKDLPGFDFSAYAAALHAVATHSPGATVFIQNDSVWGPFGDLDAMVADPQWDLTGFVGSRAVENHFSSYAFILRDVTPSRVAALAPVLSTDWCYDGFAEVVLCQETQLARVAAGSMRVGALFYLPDAPLRRSLLRPPAIRDLRGDATLSLPLDLLDRGHPFLKRSLFTKFRDVADMDAIAGRLREEGWVVSPRA